MIIIIAVLKSADTRNPTGAGAGAEMNLRVCLRAGYAQPRGFACGWVFAKPAPASAGDIPTPASDWLLPDTERSSTA